jgi:hypothetical protein
MFISFPECIYKYIKHDNDWLQFNDHLTELINNIVSLQTMSMFEANLYDQYCIQHFNIDAYNFFKNLVLEYCPQYEMLFNMHMNQYSAQQLLNIYNTSFTLLDTESKYGCLCALHNSYIRTEPEFWIWNEKFRQFVSQHQTELEYDQFHYEQTLRTSAFAKVYSSITNSLVYTTDLLKNTHRQVIDTYTQFPNLDLDNIYTCVSDLNIYILNLICMKFPTEETERQLEQDLLQFDWQLDRFDYQYKDYDINQIKFKYTLFKFFIFRHNYVTAFQILQDMYTWMNNALLDLPKLYKGMILLDNDNRLVCLSLIFILLEIPKIFTHLDLNLKNISQEDKKWISTLEFMNRSSSEEYLTRNNRHYYQRHHANNLKVLNHLKSIADEYYNTPQQLQELKQLFTTLSEQVEQLESELIQSE